MTRRGATRRRSAAEWGVRSALTAVLVMLAYVSVAQTLAYSLRLREPARAHALSPNDGRITALLAQQFAGVDASAADRVRADQLARSALREDPTAVVAASTLGIDAQIRGDMAAARRLFGYAETLSRRDLQTQLWAIEDAVGRGDVTRVLRHYDIALRTSASAPTLLYPVLATAITDSDIRAAMVRVLAAQPPWGGFFIDFVSGNGADARSTASLFIALRQAGVAIPDGANATMVNTLATRSSLDDAWNYYAASHPAVDRRKSRDPRFTATGTPSLFDWVPIEDPGTTVSLQRAERGGILDVAVSSGMGGPLVRQVQLLPSGRYRLKGRGDGIDQPVESRPYWALACRDDGRELGRVAMTNSAQDGGRFGGTIDVPVGCPAQILTLVARPSNAVSGLSVRIDQVELRPARAARSRP